MVLKHRYRNRTKKTNKKYKRNTLRKRVRRKSNKKVKRRNKKRMKGGANQEEQEEIVGQPNINFVIGETIKVYPSFKITLLNDGKQEIVKDISIKINKKINNQTSYKKDEYEGIIDNGSFEEMFNELNSIYTQLIPTKGTQSIIYHIDDINKITRNVRIVKETFGKEFFYFLFFYDEQNFGIPLSM